MLCFKTTERHDFSKIDLDQNILRFFFTGIIIMTHIKILKENDRVYVMCRCYYGLSMGSLQLKRAITLIVLVYKQTVLMIPSSNKATIIHIDETAPPK